MLKLTKPETLIFDMDGTLWDATASYAHLWNVCSAEFGCDKKVSAEILKQYMGKQLEEILLGLFGCEPPFDIAAYISRLSEIENESMARIGGYLYPGVAHGLCRLAEKYKIMAQSNCGRLGLKNFIKWSGLNGVFADTLTFGESPVSKAENIRLLMARNHIADAVYVGDTQSDCNNAHKAGAAFVHAAYGFGSCDDAEMNVNDFQGLVDYFMQM